MNRQKIDKERLDINNSYAASYFRNNPNVDIDTHTPLEKIQVINMRLQDSSLDETTRFNCLVQKKSLVSLQYGENSEDYIASLIDIGSYYNQQSRSSSAQRHLQNAQNLASSVKISPELHFRLAIEYSESLLATPYSNKVEGIRIKSLALDSLKPFESYQPTDPILNFKRELLMARAFAISESFDTTFQQYKKAKSFIKTTEYGGTVQEAKLYREIGDFCCSNKTNGDKYYNSAKKIYESLGMKEEIESMERHKLQISVFQSDVHVSESQ